MNDLTTATPLEIDTAVAALWRQVAANQARHASAESTIHSAVGSTQLDRRTYKYHRTMTTPQAVEAAHAALDALAAHFAATGGYIDAPPGPVRPYDQDKIRRAFATIEECRAEAARLDDQLAPLDAEYDRRPWSRFFLVTSSAGHIHSSMRCSTCRPTTTYGWLPELSGHSEADAVAAHGPALCSVCFASAPVEHQGGRITKARAVKLAA